jgi:2-dehydropantoate 2-reductase
MNILVFGAGAVGAYIGGSLALAAERVVFLERPEVACQLVQSGLILKLIDREEHISSLSLADSIPGALAAGPFDLAVITLKSFDTQEFLNELAPHRKAIPPILCLQNGVENETSIGACLGEDKVIPGSLTSAISRLATGSIVLERLRGIGIANNHPLSPRIIEAMNHADLNARLFSDAASMKWSKMLTNLLGNATSAILDMTPVDIFAHPGLYRLEILQLREALTVMRAQGIRVVDLPKTPVRLLAFIVERLPLSISHPLVARIIAGGRGNKMPSFHIDLHGRRGKSEVDYLNGAIVRFGKRNKTPTPVNRLLNDTLLALTDGRIPLEAYSHHPEKLLTNIWSSIS